MLSQPPHHPASISPFSSINSFQDFYQPFSKIHFLGYLWLVPRLYLLNLSPVTFSSYIF